MRVGEYPIPVLVGGQRQKLTFRLVAVEKRVLIPWVAADVQRIGRDIIQNYLTVVTYNVHRIKTSFHPQVTYLYSPSPPNQPNPKVQFINYGSTTLYFNMVKFFLEKASQRRSSKSPPDYRIISYFKLFQCLKKVRLFTIQKLIRMLKKTQSKQTEDRLNALKACHPSVMRWIAAYILQSELNFNLERQEQFFEKKLGCGLEEAISGVKEKMENEGSGENILIKAIKKHQLFQEVQDQIQKLLGKVERKMGQTKQKKQAKKVKVKLMKQNKERKERAEGEEEMEVEVRDGSEEVHYQQAEEEQTQQKSFKTKSIAKNNENHTNISKKPIKTRYDNKPKPRTEFKKTGRNKHLKQKKQQEMWKQRQQKKQQQTNKFLSSNQQMHPSWQAKLEQSRIVPFQGKRIVFS